MFFVTKSQELVGYIKTFFLQSNQHKHNYVITYKNINKYGNYARFILDDINLMFEEHFETTIKCYNFLHKHEFIELKDKFKQKYNSHLISNLNEKEAKKIIKNSLYDTEKYLFLFAKNEQIDMITIDGKLYRKFSKFDLLKI